LHPLGYHLDDAAYSRLIGLRSDDSQALVREMFHIPLAAETMRLMLQQAWDAAWQVGMPPMPGLATMHTTLQRRNLRWGVATSSDYSYAEGVLTHLGLRQMCSAIAGGNEVAQAKPAPDVYLLAATRLGVAPAHCLAVEDSGPGCQAAAKAGMTVAVIPHAQTHSAEFSCAAHRFNSLTELAANLDHLLNGVPGVTGSAS
jgi:HAD superfamily hydrolase (TIGR01509 family)